jgi:hypothetical protein
MLITHSLCTIVKRVQRVLITNSLRTHVLMINSLCMHHWLCFNLKYNLACPKNNMITFAQLQEYGLKLYALYSLTHPRMRTHTRYSLAHTCTHTPTHTHTRTHMHVSHWHTRTRTRTHTCIHTQSHTITHAQTYTRYSLGCSGLLRGTTDSALASAHSRDLAANIWLISYENRAMALVSDCANLVEVHMWVILCACACTCK